MEIKDQTFQQNNTQDTVNVVRAAYLRILIDVILSVGFFLLAPIIGVVQGLILSVVFFFGAISTIIGVVLARRGRLTTGMYLGIGSFIVEILSVVLFFEGLGPFGFVALMSNTGLIALLSLPRREGTRAIIISAAIGVIAVLADIFLGGAAFRVPIPTVLQPIIIAMIGITAAMYGFVLLRNFNNFSLRTKLIVSFTLIAIVPLGLLGFLNDISTRNTLTEEANEALFAAAQQTTDSIQDFISTNLFAISTEVRLPTLVSYLSGDSRLEEQALQTLNALRAQNDAFIISYALTSSDNGRVLLDTDASNIGQDVSDEAYYREALGSGQATVSDVVLAPDTGVLSLYFSSPVRNEVGEIIGVLSVRYNADILQNLVARSNGLVGEDSFGVLFDENLIHLAHGAAPTTILTAVMPFSNDARNALVESNRLPAGMDESQVLNLPKLASHLELAKESPEGVAFFQAEDIATGNRLNQAVALDLGSPPWILVFFQPQDVFLAPAQTQTRTSILISIVLGSVVVGLAIAMAQLLARPITSLRETATQVAAGDLNAQAEITTSDEIGDLANTFNSMTGQLSALVSGLEEQVAERTQDLEQRAVQLQTAAEVARDATRETNLTELLVRAVQLISDRFDLYHVGIYLVDERNEYAVLHAASGDAGALMLESEHRIQVGSNNAVGSVTRIGQARVASDESETVSLTRHPLLPETSAQMVLPLNDGERVIGSLDLHSTNSRELQEDTIAIYQTMADQLAVAIQKTELLTEIGQTLRELETAYGRYTREAWQSFLHSDQSHKGYRYRQLSIEPINETSEDVKLAWQAGEIISRESESNGQQASVLAVPMKVRGQVIGVLNLSFEGEHIPGETREIIEEIAERLGLVLENARLLENAQQRADRERLSTEISARMRETLDIQTILQNSAQEIRQALNLSQVSIRLASAPEQTNGHENQNEIPSENTDDGKI